MKYGVLYNKNNINIGDDIQAYATARFLPSVDYFIDREHIDEFVTDNKKAVAVLMNAWYMWAKWNWPPSKYIYPHFIGFHYADHQLANQIGTPVKYEFLEGVGGKYLKAYEPIGCRDKFTMGRLQDLGINAYFTGCITLTLPKQPETAEKNSYICLVDVDARVVEKIQKQMEGTGIEVRVFCHNRERDPDMPWEKRLEIIKERLTIYQNARCVVTKRLHCALPCLAMEVPVFLVKGMTNDIRFDPYYDFLHRATVHQVLDDNYDYDFVNPPENKDLYKPVREALIKSCEEFVEKTKTMDDDPDKLDKTTYSNEELLQWRHDTMKSTLDNWYFVRREDMTESIRRKRKVNDLTATVDKLRKEKSDIKEKAVKRLERIEKLKQKNENITNEKNKLEEKKKSLEKQLETELNRSTFYVFKRNLKKKLKKFKK